MIGESKKQISAGIVISYLVIIAQFLAGILYTPIVLKTLGQNQYGIYSLCTSFMGYFTMMNGGVNAAYIRFFVQTKEKNPNELSKLNGLFLKLFSVFAVIALAGGVFAGMFSPELFGDKITAVEYEIVKECFWYLSFSSAFQVINCVFSSLIIANEKFIFGKTVNLLMAVANPVLTIPFLFAGYDCVVIIIIHLVTNALALFIVLIYCWKTLKVRFDLKEKDTKLLRDVSIFAGFIIIQGVSDQINWQLDKFILARTHGTEEISIYTVGATFNKYFLMFSGALSNVFIAQINKLQARNDKEGLNDLFIRSSRIFSYFIWFFVIAFVLFGEKFVVRWAGKDYESSFIVGTLLMLPVTASLTMGLGQDIARAMNKHRLQILINLGICVVNAIVSIPLAIKWGAVGSAVGTFLAEILMCIIAEPIYYIKVLGLDVKNMAIELLKIVPGIVLPIAFGISINLLKLLKAEYANIIFWGIIFAAIYFISMWIFALNQSEKSTIRNIFAKFSKQNK